MGGGRVRDGDGWVAFRWVLGDGRWSKESFWSRLLASDPPPLSPVGVAPAGLRERKVRGRNTACFLKRIVGLNSSPEL